MRFELCRVDVRRVHTLRTGTKERGGRKLFGQRGQMLLL